MISTQSKRPPVSLALLCIAAVLASVSLASAQTRQSLPPNSPFAGGVPEGMLSKETVQLTVLEVIERALRHNLGVLLSEQDHASHSSRTAAPTDRVVQAAALSLGSSSPIQTTWSRPGPTPTRRTGAPAWSEIAVR